MCLVVIQLYYVLFDKLAKFIFQWHIQRKESSLTFKLLLIQFYEVFLQQDRHGAQM